MVEGDALLHYCTLVVKGVEYKLYTVTCLGWLGSYASRCQ